MSHDDLTPETFFKQDPWPTRIRDFLIRNVICHSLGHAWTGNFPGNDVCKRCWINQASIRHTEHH